MADRENSDGSGGGRHKRTKTATQLRHEFREEFCRKMDEWAAAFRNPLSTDSESKRNERKEFAKAWSRVRLAIGKSNALWRLLYAGEELRKTSCPVHKGHWSGIGSDPGCGCWSYGNITGWLAEHPENPDAPAPPVRIVRLGHDTGVSGE